MPRSSQGPICVFLIIEMPNRMLNDDAILTCQIGVTGHRCRAPSHSDSCVLWVHPARQIQLARLGDSIPCRVSTVWLCIELSRPTAEREGMHSEADAATVANP